MGIDTGKLKQVALFSKLGDADLDTLASKMRPLHMEAGQDLVTEGVTTRGPLMIITEGQVEVSRQSKVLVTVEPPTAIGEMEFLAEIQSSATVTAKTEVSGYLLPRALFEKLMEEEDRAAYHLALSIGRFVSERLAETNILLTKALSSDPERMEKVQRAQLSSEALENIDAELDALLES